MNTNKELELAWNFVEKTNRSIFLTGKAGTGKTTFLHKIKSESKKRLIVVAPTGVAAINAKGVTIHSFFQMPFGPILPNSLLNANYSSYQMKFNKTKINIIRSLDLLIIDEISMVRADLLDGIDQVLRKYKDRNKAFGGVQVLMIGDLQQLSPIVRPNEWRLLKEHYENMFFFNSMAYKLSNTVGIELKHIYRQEDENFIKVLNEIRNNNLSEEGAEMLNKRYIPDFEDKNNEYIILTTHNNKADRMNKTAYNKLDTKKVTYEAEVHKKFSESSYPLPEKLELREGAQVMFIKNDSSAEKRYYNGKIGKIISLNDKELTVKCQDEEIIVTTETWENINYTLNNETKEIESKVAGTFTQIPLKLAWAITIHKSQGLTFEKAVIDADDSFAHGQTYVALSRCKTLEGLVLETKLSSKSIISDNRVDDFTKDVEANLPNEQELSKSEKAYQLSLVTDIFNYKYFIYHPKRIIDLYYRNTNSIQGDILDRMLYIVEKLEQLLKISDKFNFQIKTLSQEVNNIASDAKIQERLIKAFDYFLDFTKKNIGKQLNEMSFSTENKAVKKDINYHLKNLKEKLNIKLYELKALQKGFSVQIYLSIRANAVLQDVKAKIDKPNEAYSNSTEHQILFKQLRSYRFKKAEEKGVEVPLVFIQRSLYEMCNLLPSTKKQLKKVHGMGKVRIENYGDDILKIITEYCIKNDIELTKDSVEIFKPKKGSSQHLSLEMFKEGKSIDKIAENRELAKSTIEGHLAQFIVTGEIKAIDLMPEKKYNELKEIMQKTEFKGFGDLKAKVGDKFSYADLRIVAKGIECEESLFNK